MCVDKKQDGSVENRKKGKLYTSVWKHSYIEFALVFTFNTFGVIFTIHCCWELIRCFFNKVIGETLVFYDPMSVYTLHELFLAVQCTVWLSRVFPLFSSLSGTLCFEQQVLLNPVIAISDEEIKAMQQFWGQNICFPTHLSLTHPQVPIVWLSLDVPS